MQGEATTDKAALPGPWIAHSRRCWLEYSYTQEAAVPAARRRNLPEIGQSCSAIGLAHFQEAARNVDIPLSYFSGFGTCGTRVM